MERKNYIINSQVFKSFSRWDIYIGFTKRFFNRYKAFKELKKIFCSFSEDSKSNTKYFKVGVFSILRNNDTIAKKKINDNNK